MNQQYKFPTVRNTARKCNCGQTTKGKETVRKTETETFVECTWTCQRCGSKFGRGIISRTPNAK